jgi:hypothetical protein
MPLGFFASLRMTTQEQASSEGNCGFYFRLKILSYAGFALLRQLLEDGGGWVGAAESFVGIFAVVGVAFDEGEEPGVGFVLTGEGDGGEQGGAEPGVL